MRANRMLAAAVAAALLGSLPFLACGPPAGLRVLSPRFDETVVWMPLTIAFDFAEDGDIGSLAVLLNGEDIAGLFQLAPPEKGRIVATATGVWDGLVAGKNDLNLAIRFGERWVLVAHRFEASGDPHADVVDGFSPGSSAGFGQSEMDGIVLGGPVGSGLFQGGTDVVSLGLSGTIELSFTDNVVVDGPGVDFTVFENSFLGVTPQLESDEPFSEPGRVSVSQDGQTWYTFPCALLLSEAPYHPGCAGVYPVLSDAGDPMAPHPSIPSTEPIEDLVGEDIFTLTVAGSGGDSFDLADVGLAWARHVRIESASFVDGPSGPDNAGFDLDAVTAVHAVPAADLDGNGIPDAVE